LQMQTLSSKGISNCTNDFTAKREIAPPQNGESLIQ
jgi:hypothetical protein